MTNETSGTLTSSGAFSDAVTGILMTPDQSGPDSQGVLVVSGTFTGATVKVEVRASGSSVWAAVGLRDTTTGTVHNGSASPTDSTTTRYRFDCAGAAGGTDGGVRAYFSAGTITAGVLTLNTGTAAEFGSQAPVVQVTSGGSQTFGDVLITDSNKLKLGTDSDFTVGWDGTDIDVLAAADNTMITIGASGNSFDFKVFGADANGFFTWDASANDLKFEDSCSVMFGTGAGAGVGNAGDVEVRWDGTDLDMLAAADDSVFKIGTGTNSFDVWLFGNAASTYVSWDASADSMKFEDNCYLGFGTNTAGPGTKGDINITWNGTKLLVAQTTANSAIDWGVDGAGIDQVWYGDTASTNVTWDQSADSLIFNGAAPLVFTGTTGQPFIGLTDNLADALSCGIAGSTDLFVLTTTDNAESFSPIGLRCRQSTAVAITGATTLKLSDSGGIFTVSQAAAYDIDLPSPTSGAGCRYFFHLTGAAANNVTITVAGAAATFVGTITIDGATIPATGSTLTFASGASVLGDSIEIQSLATNLYHVRAIASGAGGITIA